MWAIVVPLLVRSVKCLVVFVVVWLFVVGPTVGVLVAWCVPVVVLCLAVLVVLCCVFAEPLFVH